MSDQAAKSRSAAKLSAGNEIGVIVAIFTAVVYGFASAVAIFASSFTEVERIPIAYFLVLFPVLVLFVLIWLTSLDAKGNAQTSEVGPRKVTGATGAAAAINDDGWRNSILWVDDRPENNTHERQVLEALGLRFTLALSTEEAFERLSAARYAAIISDMGRKEGPREGYVLLDRLRAQDDQTPLFFYAGSNAPEHKQEALDHGSQGSTNNAQELFEMVTKAVIRRLAA
ncbi:MULTISPECIES: response regulator [unclassified Mesorhizobium]|uniref:response regulator n=1 Tax=unclassified Mesorhizobium TaxID=325217 RepID=UPI0004CE1336|nr:MULTISPECIES: response regulator [unclassified Mesorhizobium]